MLVDDNARRIATVGNRCGTSLVGRVVGEDAVGAKLLRVRLTLRAAEVGTYEAANTDGVSNFVFRDSGTDGGDFADDLVAGNTGISSGHHAGPLIARGMQVRVTNATEENVDLDVAIAGLATLDGGGG
jgi:hypothetical protein